MKALLLLLIALTALLACQARPMVYVSRLTADSIGSSGRDTGIAFGLVTRVKGQGNRRLRIFGTHSMTSEITSIALSTSGGTKIGYQKLKMGKDQSVHKGRYFYGSYRLNKTDVAALNLANLFLTIFTSTHPQGHIGGAFESAPRSAITSLDSTQVLANPASNKYTGLGYVSIKDPETLPTAIDELFDAFNAIRADITIVHDVIGATSAAFRAGKLLKELSRVTNRDAYEINIPANKDYLTIPSGDAYLQITDASSKTIRGDLIALNSLTRGLDLNSIAVSSGTFTLPENIRTLAHAENHGSNTKPESIMTVEAAEGSYVGYFLFKSPVLRKNRDLLRGFVLQVNLQQDLPSEWSFDLFDEASGEHVPIGSYSKAGADYTIGEAHYFRPDASRFLRRKKIAVRVMSSSDKAVLNIDQLSLRAYTANGAATDFVKHQIHVASLLEYN